MKKRVRIVVTGRVQGVFFRATTRETAAGLGLGGTVRNLPDGAVEVVAEGDDGAVDRLVAWCRQGPSRARVEEVTYSEEPYVGEFDDFRIVYSHMR